MVQYEFVGRETQAFRDAKRCHDGDELFIDYADIVLHPLRGGRVRKRDRRGQEVPCKGGCAAFVPSLSQPLCVATPLPPPTAGNAYPDRPPDIDISSARPHYAVLILF